MRNGIPRTAVLASILVLAGATETLARGLVRIDGSSTVFPITEAVAEEFQNAERGAVRVTVGISGTGGGFKKFCRGETDLCDASRPIQESERKMCARNGIRYIELPVAYDGLAVMVNRKNTWVDHLTVAELKKIWEPAAEGKVTRWSQVRNGWPDKTIRLYGPGTDSGTFDYFTEAINGKEKASRADFTASEDDNILVQGIAGDEGSLGYFGMAYYEANRDRLKLVPIDDGKDGNGKGPVVPTFGTIVNGTYQPLSRPLFLYVSAKSAERPEVRRFVTFYLANAAALSKEVGYVSLPSEAYALGQARFDRRMTGSVFGGHGSQVGVKIEELLKKEGK